MRGGGILGATPVRCASMQPPAAHKCLSPDRERARQAAQRWTVRSVSAFPPKSRRQNKQTNKQKAEVIIMLLTNKTQTT